MQKLNYKRLLDGFIDLETPYHPVGILWNFLYFALSVSFEASPKKKHEYNGKFFSSLISNVGFDTIENGCGVTSGKLENGRTQFFFMATP